MKLNPSLRDDADLSKWFAILNDGLSFADYNLVLSIANIAFAMGRAYGTKEACDAFERLVKGA